MSGRLESYYRVVALPPDENVPTLKWRMDLGSGYHGRTKKDGDGQRLHLSPGWPQRVFRRYVQVV